MCGLLGIPGSRGVLDLEPSNSPGVEATDGAEAEFSNLRFLLEVGVFFSFDEAVIDGCAALT